MIEDHVGAIGQAGSVFTAVTGSAQPDAQKTTNGITGAGEGYPFIEQNNTVTRCCLSGNGNICGNNNIGCQVDDTANGKNDKTAGCTNGITKRTGAAVVQVGNYINGR